MLLAHVITPFVRRTAAFRTQRATTTDRPMEIALWFLAHTLTVNGTLFDPEVRFDGLEELVRLRDEGRPVLLIQPHSAMTHLSFRRFFDAGLNPVAVNNAPGMCYAGTSVSADPVLPGPHFLLFLRNRLREGRLVCAALDRADHEEGKTVVIETPSGPVIIAPVLLDLTLRRGGQVAFTRCWLHGLGVRAEIVLPSSSDVEGLTREYAAYISRDRLAQAAR